LRAKLAPWWFLGLLWLLAAPHAWAATTATVTPGDWPLYRGSTIVSRHASEAACVAAAKALNVARSYTCRTSTGVAVTITPDVCPAQPAAETQAVQCPAGTTGSWQQTRSYVAAPFPTCWTAGAWSPATAPAGACVTTPPDPQPPSPAGLINPFLPLNPADKLEAQVLLFGKTAMNDVKEPGYNVPLPYDVDQGYVDLSTKEPWLFDRASTFYVTYLRTGDPKWKAEALRLVPLYYAAIDATGLFMPAQATWYGDTKYSYIDPILWYEKETGDKQYRAKAKAIWEFQKQYNPKGYSTTQTMWTERHHNYALRASLAYWKLTGDPVALQDAKEYADTVFSMSAATGAPLHGDGQHEGGTATLAHLITSPWMGAMLAETMAAYGRETGDARVTPWLARYADFIAKNCLWDGATYPDKSDPGVAIHLANWYWPAYLCGDGGYAWSDNGPWDDVQHSGDVAGLIAHGIWAKKQLGQDATALRAAYKRLTDSALLDWADYTDRGATNAASLLLPKYRLKPPRKFSWAFGSTYDNSYLIQ